MQNERPRTWVEVDLGQIKKNYRLAMTCVGNGARAMAVVKSNAYGHGMAAVAMALYDCGVRRFAVASIGEASELRAFFQGLGFDGCDILILGYTPIHLIGDICALNVSQTIVSEEYADELASRVLPEHQGLIHTHLALDTGMNRIGIDARDLNLCASIAKKHKDTLGIKAVFTHLSAADSDSTDDIEFTERQLMLFDQARMALVRLGITEAHCLNSAGMLRYSTSLSGEFKGLVRPGIVLYGLRPGSCELPSGIAPALTWKTRIAMLKTVRKGEYVGYGRAFKATRDMQVATLPVGYADGYPRALSGIGSVLINGASAPIIGNVCMNQMMADATGIAGARSGGDVTLIGEGSPADRLAELSGTISYEIISRIDSTIPRVYTDD